MCYTWVTRWKLGMFNLFEAVWNRFESLMVHYWNWVDRRSFKRHPLAKRLQALDTPEFDALCTNWLSLSGELRALSFSLTVPEATGLELDANSILALAPVKVQVDAVLAARRAWYVQRPEWRLGVGSLSFESPVSPLTRFVSWAAYYLDEDAVDLDFTVLPYSDEIYLPHEAKSDSWFRGADLVTATVFAWAADEIVGELREEWDRGDLPNRLVDLWQVTPELTRVRDQLRQVNAV